jgi:geranylgeranyl diphosphate synthase type I
MSEEDYLRMIELKTAHLFKAAIQVGAVLGKADENELDELSNYVTPLGIGYQLYDDLIDISPGKKGHALCSDIKKGKSGLLIKRAFEKSSEKQKAVLHDTWGNEDADQEMIQAVIDVLHTTGAVDYVRELAEEKTLLGKSALETAGFSQEAKTFFMSFADFMVSREL